MTTTRTLAASAAEFIARLESLAKREDRAALAALRRGLGKPPGTVAEMAPYVEPAFDGAPDEAYIVASLFGLHPHHYRAERQARRADHGGANPAAADQDFLARGNSRASLTVEDDQRHSGVARLFEPSD